MRRVRSFTLLEVLVGLALLAGMAVWLLELQAASVRQYRQARELERLSNTVEELLWTWSERGEPVTLPASGSLGSGYSWRREAQPVWVTPGVCVTQVTVTITSTRPDAFVQDIYRVDWLVPRANPGGRR